MQNLTDAKVRAAKPDPAKARKLADGGGLHLLIQPTGSKLWQVRYTYGGKEKTLSLGAYPAVPLKDARIARDDAKAILAAGQDPGVARKIAKATAVAATGTTFESIARQWHTTNMSKWSAVHTQDVLGSLVKHVFPLMGGLPIASITPGVVLTTVRAIEGGSGVETARRVRQRLSAVFEFGIALGVCPIDPASQIKTVMAPLLQRTNQPAITDLKALREMLAKVEGLPAHPVTKLAMRFIALTVVRPGTLHTTPWAEFDALETPPVWKIPADRMKMDREHWIPLPTQAMEIIAALRPITGSGPYAFPNDRWAHRPMSENALLMLLYRAGYRGVHSPHGWRASFNTIMSERHQGDVTTDRALDVMLAHASNKGPYNRALVLDRRRELAQEWADLLLESFAPAVSLAVGRRR